MLLVFWNNLVAATKSVVLGRSGLGGDDAWAARASEEEIAGWLRKLEAAAKEDRKRRKRALNRLDQAIAKAIGKPASSAPLLSPAIVAREHIAKARAAASAAPEKSKQTRLPPVLSTGGKLPAAAYDEGDARVARELRAAQASLTTLAKDLRAYKLALQQEQEDEEFLLLVA